MVQLLRGDLVLSAQLLELQSQAHNANHLYCVACCEPNALMYDMQISDM